MEAFFDNKASILNAYIRISRDNSAIYSVKTTFGLQGRKITVLRDENPIPGRPTVAGLINWREGTFEIYGYKRRISEIKRKEGGFLKRSYHWRWLQDGKEFEIKYDRDIWKATLNHNMLIAARFSVPFRPHLFSKPSPSMLHLTKAAFEDEVFLILIFIYSEMRRQDKTNSSSVNGGIGW